MRDAPAVPQAPALPRALLAEALGTMLLLAIVIGSGIMAERLSGGNVALALLANTAATVGRALHPHRGVRAGERCALQPGREPGDGAARCLAQGPCPGLCAGATGCGGGWRLAGRTPCSTCPCGRSRTSCARARGQWIAEAVATAGLLLVILRAPAGKASAMVAAYIGAAYWFTASTSFANPAAAFGRMASDSFAGIAPSCVPGFVAAQVIGALAGWAVAQALSQRTPTAA